MLRITKKEAIFFTYLSNMTVIAHDAATKLENLMNNYNNVEAKLKEITDLEHECDLIVHDAIYQLNIAFITPLDREDIFLLLKELDNIVDNIEEAALRFDVFNVVSIKTEAIEFATNITKATMHLKILVEEMKKLKPTDTLKKEIIIINDLEHIGDGIYRNELKKLFSDEKDLINVLRWKGIYDYLEKSLDSCEYIANTIEGIVMKHA